jgi:hypothetical protein
MPFQDKENLSDLYTFGNTAYFNDDVWFYGNVYGLDQGTITAKYAENLQSKNSPSVEIGSVPYQSKIGDEPTTSFTNAGTAGYFLKSNGAGNAPEWAAIAAPTEAIPSGSAMLFYQASAPTGWTKQTTHNDKSLRVVSGTGGGSGGSTAFTSVFTSRTPTGSVSGSTDGASANLSIDQALIGIAVDQTTLSTAQMPNHGHSFENGFFAENNGNYGNFGSSVQGSNNGHDNDNRPFTRGDNTGGAGSSNSHSHSLSQNSHAHGISQSNHSHGMSASFSGNSMDFAVQYVDVIICTRN